MSLIQKAILKVCGIDAPEKGEKRQAFLARCCKAINKLDDDDYNKLDAKVVAWFDKAADTMQANKKNDKDEPLPDFPDAEDEDAPASRRRVAEDDEKPRRGKKDDAEAESTIKLGTMVTVVKKNGRTVEGKLVEREKDVVVVEVDGKEKEIDMEDVETIKVFNDGAGKDKGDDEPAGPREPAVGDTITFKTKRGRAVEGELVEIDGDTIVVKTGEGEEDFSLSRIDGGVSIAIRRVVAGDKKPKDEDKASDDEKPRRGKKDDAEDKADDKKPARASNGGVSVGMKIKELIVDNLDMTRDQIGKLLDKEKLEYRQNTLDLAYNDAHKLITLLKERKLLKV